MSTQTTAPTTPTGPEPTGPAGHLGAEPPTRLSSKELRRSVGKLLRSADRRGVLPIVQAGHPVLRSLAQPYDGELSPELLGDLVEAMRATMHDAPGVGLAAPQIGLGLAVAVVEDAGDDDADDPRERNPLPFAVLVNPRYTAVDDALAVHFEGCLSVVGYEAVVARHHTIRLECADEHGRDRSEVLSGWPARIIQHETDHLAGTLYVDKADLRTLASTDLD